MLSLSNKVVASTTAEKNLGKTEPGLALVQVTGLSGDALCELQFDVSHKIRELKDHVLPLVLSGASKDAQLNLFYDGSEALNDQTLASIGIEPSGQVNLTALVYDPHKLVIMEINRLHQEAVERSRLEAVQARRQRQEERARLIAERKLQVEREYVARQDQPEGPLLMLTAEAIQNPQGSSNLPASSQRTDATQNESLLMLPAPPMPAQLQNGSMLSEVHTRAEPSCASTRPAIPDWREAAKAIVAAYEAFFDHISFRKGWKQPPFPLEDARPVFTIAARIVSHARIEVLDARDAGFKIRQLEGSARDWMHSPEHAVLLRDDKQKFLAGLVHATFKDARGYVEGLDEKEVNDFIQRYNEEAHLIE